MWGFFGSSFPQRQKSLQDKDKYYQADPYKFRRFPIPEAPLPNAEMISSGTFVSKNQQVASDIFDFKAFTDLYLPTILPVDLVIDEKSQHKNSFLQHTPVTNVINIPSQSESRLYLSVADIEAESRIRADASSMMITRLVY